MTIVRGFRCDHGRVFLKPQAHEFVHPCAAESMTGTNLPIEWQRVETELGDEHFCQAHRPQCKMARCTELATVRVENSYLCNVICPSGNGS